MITPIPRQVCHSFQQIHNLFLCSSSSDTLFCPLFLSVQKASSKLSNVTIELAFKTPDSERKIYIRESLLFAFLSLAHCVCFCVTVVACVHCDPLSMFSLVLSSTLVGVALPTASLTTVSIATVCSLLIICTKGKRPNVTHRL